jgi:hypothetical protein
MADAHIDEGVFYGLFGACKRSKVYGLRTSSIIYCIDVHTHLVDKHERFEDRPTGNLWGGRGENSSQRTSN